MNINKVKKQLLLYLPYVIIGLVATKLGEAWRYAPGTDIGEKIRNIMTGVEYAFRSLLPSFRLSDLLIGVVFGFLTWLYVYTKGKNAKKYRKGTEYGSARWGKPEDIEPYIDPNFQNNIILTQSERLTMESRPKDPKTARNKNVLIVGGSGSGGTTH